MVGVLVDGAVPGRAARARAPDGDWFELAGRAALRSSAASGRHATTLLATELEVATPRARPRSSSTSTTKCMRCEDFARAHEDSTSRTLAYGRGSFDQFHGYRIVGALPGRRPQPIEALAISRPRRSLRQQPDAAGSGDPRCLRARRRPRSTCLRMPWFASGQLSSEEEREGIAYVDYSDIGDIPVPSLFATFLFEDLEPAVATLDGELRQRLIDRHVSSLFSAAAARRAAAGRITSPCTSGRAISSTAPIPIRTSSSRRSRYYTTRAEPLRSRLVQESTSRSSTRTRAIR